MSNGACMNPMFWQYNQGLSGSLGPFPAFANFVNGINFAAFTNLSKATVTVSGATAYGIKGDQGAFGWVSGAASGSLSISGMANGTYAVTFFNCATGTDISTSNVTGAGGALTATLPASNASGVAFKALNPNAVVGIVEQSAPKEAQLRPAPNIAYENGALHFLRPLSEPCVVNITTALGGSVAHVNVADAKAKVAVGHLGQGVYFVGITSGNNKTLQRLLVK